MALQKLNRAIKYRAYPTEEQKVLFAKTFGCVRFVWNQMLNDEGRFYTETGTHFVPTPAKYKKEFPFLKEVDSLALANAQLILNKAFSAFFDNETVGYPNFKTKKNSRFRYTTNCQTHKKKDGTLSPTICIGKNYIRLPKVGDVKICKHRSPKNGWKLKSATIERTPADKYFISVLFEFTEDIQPVEIKSAIGLDYSSPDFCVDSNGIHANYPRYYRQSEERLAREQRKLSRMEYGSANYMKQRLKVAKLHEKISNQRINFCHTLSTAIAKQYDAVFVEDINLRGMAGSLKLGKSTNDNGFGMFRNMLEYKLLEQGKIFAKVDRFFASSQICSVCGTKNPDVKNLAVREWTCSCCGTRHDRDQNAATNILYEGLRSVA